MNETYDEQTCHLAPYWKWRARSLELRPMQNAVEMKRVKMKGVEVEVKEVEVVVVKVICDCSTCTAGWG